MISLKNIIKAAPIVLAGASLVFLDGCANQKPPAIKAEQPIPVTETYSPKRNYKLENILLNKILLEEIRPHMGYIESSHNDSAESDAGARGEYQITAETWNDMMPGIPFDSAFNPELNNIARERYLFWLKDTYFPRNYKNWQETSLEKKLEVILMAYNAGPNKVLKRIKKNKEMPEETKNYIKKLKERYEFQDPSRI